ncbi:K(+)-transporting ATPase subunit C [Anaerorhabdus sp.]|uniref:K(+)-transporting ATPase subunit C n=1 Tax=Anaerorhabdus sp. TaxID=1872524 RepID=UPI002FC6B49F
MKELFKGLKKAFMISISFLVICGLIYPLVLTGIGQVFFPKQANGSLIEVNGEVVGSALIGQDFNEEYFMKGRPSAVNYNTYTEEEYTTAVSSGSSNYAPTNPELVKRVKAEIETFLKENPTVKKEDIPTDLMTVSGSGLDPHISVEGAMIQIDRIAKASNLSKEMLVEIVNKNTEGKLLGIFGEDYVNVLQVNLDIAMEMGLLNK